LNGEPIVTVAGGMGGEAAWRERVAAVDGYDDLSGIACSLQCAVELLAAGIDPGPPATWDAQAIAALEAEEERLGVDIFGRPLRNPRRRPQSSVRVRKLAFPAVV
jgi:hypothetical protein